MHARTLTLGGLIAAAALLALATPAAATPGGYDDDTKGGCLVTMTGNLAWGAWMHLVSQNVRWPGDAVPHFFNYYDGHVQPDSAKGTTCALNAPYL